MRASQLFLPTLREVPKEAELISHQLLLRGGFVKNLAAGIYSYLPLGWRVHEKIAQIVREEMNAIGGQEIHMPVLVPRELLDETGRSSVPVLFALRDKNQREFFLGFTHEEVVTDIVRGAISSWKQMPLFLYQIQTKERDEPRPRGGLIRGREFTMFDGYSFDTNEESLKAIYAKNYAAYERIFQRCGLSYLAVEADPGAIGGSENHEFMVLAESGEDTVLRCDTCTYAANAERAEIKALLKATTDSDVTESEVISTPGAHTVEQVCTMLGVQPQQLIKTIILNVEGKAVVALIRGDRELNLPKLIRVIASTSAELADASMVMRVTGAPVGFAGPVGLKELAPIYADQEIMDGAGYIVGANALDAHRTHVRVGEGFELAGTGDIRTAVSGDSCPRCPHGHFIEARGIEVGHIFQLGTKYSSAMNAVFQNETGAKIPVLMGCYGLGVSRTMAAALEAHHDAGGAAWPISIAPFEAAVILTNVKDEEQVHAGSKLYTALKANGLDILLDDREERAGVKFKDMELIGIPVQVVLGKALAEGKVELGLRGVKDRETVAIEDAADLISALILEQKAKLV